MRASLLVPIFGLLCATALADEPHRDVAMRADAESLRITEIERCIARERAAIDEVRTHIREVEARRDAADSDEATRAEANRELHAITDVVRQIEDGVDACVPRHGPRPHHVEPLTEAAEDRIAQMNDPAHVVARNIAINDDARIDAIERVDGVGHLDDEFVESAVRAVIPGFRTCYERATARAGALRGQLILTFTASQRPGKAMRVGAEADSVRDAVLRVCLTTAAEDISFSRAPTAGTVSYSATLRFGGR